MRQYLLLLYRDTRDLFCSRTPHKQFSVFGQVFMCLLCSFCEGRSRHKLHRRVLEIKMKADSEDG